MTNTLSTTDILIDHEPTPIDQYTERGTEHGIEVFKPFYFTLTNSSQHPIKWLNLQVIRKIVGSSSKSSGGYFIRQSSPLSSNLIASYSHSNHIYIDWCYELKLIKCNGLNPKESRKYMLKYDAFDDLCDRKIIRDEAYPLKIIGETYDGKKFWENLLIGNIPVTEQKPRKQGSFKEPVLSSITRFFAPRSLYAETPTRSLATPKTGKDNLPNPNNW